MYLGRGRWHSTEELALGPTLARFSYATLVKKEVSSSYITVNLCARNGISGYSGWLLPALWPLRF